MEKHANGFWHVKKIIGEVVGIMTADSTIIAELPQGKSGNGPQIAEAYLLAAAPQLLEACSRISSILENNLIVTPEGIEIDCTDIKQFLHDAILRAKGRRKSLDEPQPYNARHTEKPCRLN